ncbi:MAG: hypothetical protein IPO37_25520 [Saprospiraceae bacterium]|nr:hypothetical protein [Saprospiraceae bacterium]
MKACTRAIPKPDTKTIILVESIIDAATIKQYLPELGQTGNNIRRTRFIGTNGFTTEHEAAIKSLPDLDEIILISMGTKPGAALMKYRESLPQIKPGIKISHVETPDGEDPNSLTISHSPGDIGSSDKAKKHRAEEHGWHGPGGA